MVFSVMAGCALVSDRAFERRIDADADGLDLDADCDDNDPSVAGPTSWYVDADRDGHGQGPARLDCEGVTGEVARDGDCDDAVATIHPLAPETCDGRDEDCDGQIDDGAVDAIAFAPDEDQDGHGAIDGATVTACSPPSGFGLVADDCDDTTAEVHPDHEEICEDGADNDCDLLDADCRIVGDVEVSVAFLAMLGSTGNASAGFRAVFAGDLDLDGFEDVLIGAPNGPDISGAPSGAAHVVFGPRTGLVNIEDAGTAHFTGVLPGDQAGIGVSRGGDTDGDGVPEVLVGAKLADDCATDGGTVTLVELGTRTGWATLGAPPSHVVLCGTSASARVGESISGGFDLDGDGLDDLLAGSTFVDHGEAYALHGPLTDGDLAAAAALTIVGDSAREGVGSRVVSPGDLDGDGVRELVVTSEAGTAGSALALFAGTAVGRLGMEDGDGLLTGPPGVALQLSAAGVEDVDGDGRDDLLVGAPYESSAGQYRGAAYLFAGGSIPNGDLDSAARLVLTGPVDGGQAGYAVATASDVDEDGLGDLLVSGVGVATLALTAGTVWLVSGSVTGQADLDAVAQARFLGVDDGGMLGVALDGGTDLDGDGYADLLMAAPFASAGGTGSGSTYVFFGTGT